VSDPGPAAAWRSASRRLGVEAAFLSLRAEVAEAARRERPLCLGGGNCCRFTRFGHRLFVTGLEAAFCLGRIAAAGGRTVSTGDASEAARRGDCPFLARSRPFVALGIGGSGIGGSEVEGGGGLCTEHLERPLACRLFFCDPRAEGWQRDLHEWIHGEVKALHDREGVPYAYLEWSAALAALAAG
jgi:Fe-S-cluster containining protein